MIYPLTDLNSWPLRDNREPIFKTTGAAISYAHLIYELPKIQDLIQICRLKAGIACKRERERKDVDWDKMMVLATRAQFFRECLDEVQRIKDERYTIPHTPSREKAA